MKHSVLPLNYGAISGPDGIRTRNRCSFTSTGARNRAFNRPNKLRRQGFEKRISDALSAELLEPCFRLKTGFEPATFRVDVVPRAFVAKQVTTKMDETCRALTLELWPRSMEPPGLEPGTSSVVGM